MGNVFDRALGWMDRRMEQHVRAAAQFRGRRSFLSRLGRVAVGGALLPMLPFDRSFGADKSAVAANSDPASCEYWAYCSMGGTRCNACGGTVNQCPPGSQPSVLSWIGTCTNPAEKKAYLVSYSDCCGKTDCDAPEEAFCAHNQGERPGYRMGSYNDTNWCMANSNLNAHCSTAVIIGVADSE
jgi:methylamine dehydrogenase light chain